MNIDRHNYEEYFLLYIDNELNVEQKKQVELFVQENRDLEEELVMLKQSRLIPDDSIVFDKKHLLMKEENASGNHSFINLNNYEQWLIMYVDDELSAEENVAVENFARTHQHVQQELDLFLQTKLPAEELVFPNKEVLYRKEKAVRVISMQWWRVAVAAVLIIGAGITFYSVLHNRDHNEITPNNVAINKLAQTPAAQQSISPDTQEQAPSTRQEEKGQIAVESTPDKKHEIKKDQPEKERPQFADNLSQPGTRNLIAKDIISETRSNNVADDFTKTNIEEPKKSDVVVAENEPPKENINTPTVTNRVVETPDNKSSISDDAAQYASNAENKKFRGFFRKATRILERTTSINAADDDKVLIGGMAINLK